MLCTPPHPGDPADHTERLLARVHVALVAALTALVLAIAPSLAWSALLLVDSFTTAGSLLIPWRYLRGEGWREPWYAWTLVACATAISVALNVAYAPDRLSAQLFAALPPVALLGALELLMSVARAGLPHTDRTPAAEDPSSDRDPTAAPPGRPQLPAPDHHTTAGNGSGPQRDSSSRVRELVAHERHRHPPACPRGRAAAGISERRAYELLRAVRAEEPTPGPRLRCLADRDRLSRWRPPCPACLRPATSGTAQSNG